MVFFINDNKSNNKNDIASNYKSNIENKKGTFYKSLIATALAISLSACGGGGGSGDGGSGGGQVPGGGTSDSPPTVTAEARSITSIGDAVTLVANASDPDGDAITYSWTQISGAAISNPSGFNTASASFSAPDDVDSLVLQVTATANGRSDTAQVQVVVLEAVGIAIFVDPEFTGTSTGEIDSPFTDLAAVLDNLNAGEDVYIKSPTNDERLSVQVTPGTLIELRAGNSIYGGYNADWSRDVVNNRTALEGFETGLIYRQIDLPTVVSGIDLFVDSTQIDGGFNAIGIYADGGGSSFTVDNSSIELQDFFDNKVDNNAGHSYAMYFNDIDTTLISNSVITAGNSSNAVGQSARTTGAGRDGVDGEDARVGLNINGGDGGAAEGGGWNGGAGGNAGNTSFEPGDDGLRGSGRTDPVLVRGGSRGIGGFDADTSDAEGRDGGDGGKGDDGPKGTVGEGGSGFGRTSLNGGFFRSSGSNGGNGWAGGGGGGGGGASAGAAGANGGAGGGGGEGGEGGDGGFGAASGFASIAVHIVGGNSHTIINNQITSANGGRGGVGGTGAAGGSGGSGGAGVEGTQGFGNAKGGTGGNGGSGGDGGRGGSGGSGGGGPSFGIFIGGSTPATISNNEITTGNGGPGGSADFTDETAGAGLGGWTVGIFDANTEDNLNVIASGNTFTLGDAGPDGNPRESSGQRLNANFD